MDLNVMRYVVSVADNGNFSRAAQECHIGQPGLSQQIARLERELGITLFYRNSRGAVPTEAGRDFIRRTREILRSTEELSEQMSSYAGLHRGSLTIGIITSLQCIEFGSMLSAFVRTYPDITIIIRQSGTYQLQEMLSSREIDLAFLNQPPSGIAPGIDFRELGRDRYSLALPEDHPLALRENEADGPEPEISMKELKDERFIFHQPWQAASDFVLNACIEAGFEPNIVCRSSEPATSMYMVQGGMGIALFPDEEFRGRLPEGVIRIRIKEDIIKKVGIARRNDSESPLIAEAVRFAEEWCKMI